MIIYNECLKHPWYRVVCFLVYNLNFTQYVLILSAEPVSIQQLEGLYSTLIFVKISYEEY